MKKLLSLGLSIAILIGSMLIAFAEGGSSNEKGGSNPSSSIDGSPLPITNPEENYIRELLLLKKQFKELIREVQQRLEYRCELAKIYKSDLIRSYFNFLNFNQPELSDMEISFFAIKEIKEHISQLNQKGKSSFSSFEDNEAVINKYKEILKSITSDITSMRAKDNLSYYNMKMDFKLINDGKYDLYNNYALDAHKIYDYSYINNSFDELVNDMFDDIMK